MNNDQPSQAEIDFSHGKPVEDIGYVRGALSDYVSDGCIGPRNGQRVKLSNLIEQWVDMPKYCMSARMQTAVRSEEGMLKSVTRTFSNGQNTMTMFPARIADAKTGVEKDYFPTPTDEVIEFVLLSLMNEPSMGRFTNIDKKTRCGIVRFRLADIIKVLGINGTKKNRSDIKHSLRVMKRTQYEFKFGNGKTVQDSIITSMIEGGDTQFWTVRFSMIVSGAMDSATYRQFPFSTYLSLPSAIERWILGRMSMQTNLGPGYPHYITVAEAKDAGVVNCKNLRDNLRQLKDGIKALCDRGVLDEEGVNEHPVLRIKEAGKTVDVKLTLPGNKWLIGQSVKANTRAKNNRGNTRRNLAIPV